MTQAKEQAVTYRTCRNPGCGNQFPITNKQRAKHLCVTCAGRQKQKAAQDHNQRVKSTTKRKGGHSAIIDWERAETTEAVTAHDIMQDTSPDRIARNIDRIISGELIFAHTTKTAKTIRGCPYDPILHGSDVA